MDKKQKQKLIDHLFKSARGYGMAESNGVQSRFDPQGNYMPNKKGGTVEGGKKRLLQVNQLYVIILKDSLFGAVGKALQRTCI